MSIDFSVTTMSQMAGGATASAASSLATGSLMGNAAAQVEDPMSLLADAAEELTFAADTTDEYELEDRKEREHAESAYAERVKLYQDLMHEAGKSQNIDRLKDSLRAREGREKASREALYRFPDPSDAYAALSDALDAFSPVFFDITRTGRHLWVAVYFKVSSATLAVEQLKKATEEVNQKISSQLEECTCELILAP